MVATIESAPWCSHVRITRQPAASNSATCRWSRSRFERSFRIHHSLLCRGTVRCVGHECQKHPSIKTTSFCFANTRSGLARDTRGIDVFTRYRYPRLCKALRTLSSRALSRCHVFRMRLAEAGDDGGGVSLSAIVQKRYDHPRNLVGQLRWHCIPNHSGSGGSFSLLAESKEVRKVLKSRGFAGCKGTGKPRMNESTLTHTAESARNCGRCCVCIELSIYGAI